MPSAVDSARERGYFETAELRKANVLPPRDVVKTRRVAVIECIQDIPCNPCRSACKFNAILKEGISKPPKVDWSKCTGCKQCILPCPGLAAFTVEIKGEKGYIALPYELLPKPNLDESVVLLNRAGEKVGLGKVTQVLKPRKDEAGVIVTIEVPKPDLIDEIRAIRVIRK